MSHSCPPHHVSTAVIGHSDGAHHRERDVSDASLDLRDVLRSSSPIVHLNVGGTRFTTSRQTLLGGGNPHGGTDTFFTSLLSGRISSQRDENGAIFIDRDPDLFKVILNYLRTRTLSTSGGMDVKQVLHEAEYYGIAPLVKQLSLCADIDDSGCGDVLFYTYLPPPMVPMHEKPRTAPKPTAVPMRQGATLGHSRNSSQESVSSTRPSPPRPPQPQLEAGHSKTSSLDLKPHVGLFFGQSSWVDPLRVRIVKAHHNCIAVAYHFHIVVFKQKENTGFQPVFVSPYLEHLVERVAINAKMCSVLGEQVSTMIAFAYANNVRLMGFTEEGRRIDVGTFNLHASVHHLFFIGTQLVALSPTGKIGVWNSMTQHWQSQELAPITSYDTAGSFLLLGKINEQLFRYNDQ
jgi:hypothetical protein